MTEDGQPGYVTTGEDGADTIVPFGNGLDSMQFVSLFKNCGGQSLYKITLSVPEGYRKMILALSWFINSSSGTAITAEGATPETVLSTHVNGIQSCYEHIAVYEVNSDNNVLISISVPTTHALCTMGGALFFK